jgi:hypothetical protein
MSDYSYKFIYWDEPDSDDSETTKPKNKSFSDSLEEDE